MSQPSRPKVLIADDERVIADTLAIILQREGFDVTVAYSGRQALERAQSFQPEILISDVILGEDPVSGIEVALRVRHLFPACRVVLFSGQPEADDLLRSAQALGHNFEVLAKPAHPRDLLACLRR